MGVAEMELIGDSIARALGAKDDAAVQQDVRRRVADLCAGFPLPA
jgi:glycine/serine hydroxymethyltransferase